MGWNIGIGAGPLRYSKRLGGSPGGGGRRLSLEERQRLENSPSIRIAALIELGTFFVAPVVMVIATVTGGLKAFVSLLALMLVVGLPIYILLVIAHEQIDRYVLPRFVSVIETRSMPQWRSRLNVLARRGFTLFFIGVPVLAALMWCLQLLGVVNFEG